ncbi:hypothetical protein [Desertivirga arenae]|nr:hypothetical protein [Pedobacter sp. SYSU D00823]
MRIIKSSRFKDTIEWFRGAATFGKSTVFAKIQKALIGDQGFLMSV